MSIRNVLPSLAIALMAFCATTAQAQTVDVSLNLRYTDPFDPSEGGTWELVTKVDSGLGIAGVDILLSGIDNGAAEITLGSGVAAIDPVCAASSPCGIAGGTERNAWIIYNGSDTDLIYGQNMVHTEVIDGVGTGVGTAGDNGTDVLRNATWDNAALLASGTFSTATRPTFTTKDGNPTSSNVYSVFDIVTPAYGVISSTATTTTVRGDSLDTLGLENTAGTGILSGDANRDGTVNFLDFSALSGGFGATGVDPNEPIWDIGNFNDDANVDFLDFSALSGSFGSGTAPPALGGLSVVPEPSSVVLATLFGLGVSGLRRRRRLV